MTQIYTTELENGLKIIGEYIPESQSAALGFFVRTGARDETKVEAGVSHFLEHMMFKGTKKRTSLEITFEMGSIGAQSNAFTSEEQTVYYGVVLPEYCSKMQEILSDMLRPALDPAEFDMEKKVILEEIALYQDRPHFYLFENALEDFFGGHPAGNSVLGTTASVGAVTRDQMAAYFDRRYSPSNIVYVVTGKFDWDTVVKDAGVFCGNWPRIETPRPLPKFNPARNSREFRKANLYQSHLLLMSKGPSAQDDARFPMAILSTILGDSSGSRMYWNIVQPGLAESASADNDERDGAGVFYSFASCEVADQEKVEIEMRKILSTPLEFSDADFLRAKRKLLARIVFSGESTMGRMMALGREWQYNARIHNLQDTMDKIQAVTRKDIESLVEEYPTEPTGVYRLLPE